MGQGGLLGLACCLLLLLLLLLGGGAGGPGSRGPPPPPRGGGREEEQGPVAEGGPWGRTGYEAVKKHLGAAGALSKQYWQYLACKVWQEGCGEEEEEEEESGPGPGKRFPPFSPSPVPQKQQRVQTPCFPQHGPPCPRLLRVPRVAALGISLLTRCTPGCHKHLCGRGERAGTRYGSPCPPEPAAVHSCLFPLPAALAACRGLSESLHLGGGLRLSGLS